jgi:hypothetical protein
MADNFAALKKQMTDSGLAAGTPGWKIVLAAGLKPPTGDKLYGDSDQIAIVKLMKAYNAYGRKSWKWEPSALLKKDNLILGSAKVSYCQGFNNNFAVLAMYAFGMQKGDFTIGRHQGQFITRPSKECIDSKWKGNVRTPSKNISAMGCYKFNDHYWVKWHGANLDVCYNRVFSGPESIVLSALDSADAQLAKDKGYKPNELFKLAKRHPEGDHLVMIKQKGVNNWPEWMIVPEADIPKKK